MSNNTRPARHLLEAGVSAVEGKSESGYVFHHHGICLTPVCNAANLDNPSLEVKKNL
jgi:hypothetical protein